MAKLLNKLKIPAPEIVNIASDYRGPVIEVYDSSGRKKYNCQDFLPDDESHTCEQICKELSQRLGIGLISSQLLGLQVTENEETNWLGPLEKLENCFEKEVCLRFRHIPSKHGYTKRMDKQSIEYLYYQILDEFRNEKFQLSENFDEAGVLKVVTEILFINFLLKAQMDSTLSVKKFISETDVAEFIPKSFQENDIFSYLYNTQKKGIFSKLKTMNKDYPADKVSIQGQIESFLTRILDKKFLKSYFYEETFVAKSPDSNNTMADILVYVDKGVDTHYISICKSFMVGTTFG